MRRASIGVSLENSPRCCKAFTLEWGDERHEAALMQCRVEGSSHPLETVARFTARRISLLITVLILHVPWSFDNRLLVTEGSSTDESNQRPGVIYPSVTTSGEDRFGNSDTPIGFVSEDPSEFAGNRIPRCVKTFTYCEGNFPGALNRKGSGESLRLIEDPRFSVIASGFTRNATGPQGLDSQWLAVVAAASSFIPDGR